MAAAVQVFGPALVKTGTGAVDALESLGYTRDGVYITEQVYDEEVPGDQNGGPGGPPIDIEYYGERHIVRCELTKWDSAIAAKVFPKLKGGTAGTPGTPGTLWYGDSKFFRLLIQPTSGPRNYLGAIPRGAPIEINLGVKYSVLIVTFECYSISGTLYNSTTS